MEFSIKLNTIKSEWSTAYSEEPTVIISKTIMFFFFKIDFVIANSADPEEMPHQAEFHLVLNSLQNYLLRDIWSTKGFN